MENRIKIGVLMIGVILVVVSMINILRAEINTSNPEYQKVLNELDKTDWVRVIVSVDTASARESIISSLSENEFRYLRRSEFEKMFVGEISKSGLDKLVNNINIKFVSMDVTLSPSDNESRNNITKEHNPEGRREIKNELNWLLGFIGIVIMIIIILIVLNIKIKRDEGK